jgi:putative Ca2+/H+ antiporter (TMEM165/GDT1 family)
MPSYLKAVSYIAVILTEYCVHRFSMETIELINGKIFFIIIIFLFFELKVARFMRNLNTMSFS